MSDNDPVIRDIGRDYLLYRNLRENAEQAYLQREQLNLLRHHAGLPPLPPRQPGPDLMQEGVSVFFWFMKWWLYLTIALCIFMYFYDLGVKAFGG